jgi:2-polyprenyl-6-methoxyphenol hydroxylase-like FAD-dependent oxidoreductase
MKPKWDVIIIGARIAGATLASYLGAAGLRVLLLDRAHFPSDIPQQASWDIQANRIWEELDVLPSIERAGVPRQTAHFFATGDIIAHYTYADLGGLAFRMTARRMTLDQILSQHAASYPTVELRTDFPVHALCYDGERVTGIIGGKNGQACTETASLVVGADGRYSWLARQVQATTYEGYTSPWASYIAHYTGTNVQPGVGHHARTTDAMRVAMMAEAGMAIVSISIRLGELESFRRNLPYSFEERLRDHPYFRELLGAGKREGAIGGACDLRMYKRTPYGPGWALVGDAGYHLDPMAARGVTATLVSARLLAEALRDVIAGHSSWKDALNGYHRMRDEQLLSEWNLTHRVITQGTVTKDDLERARLLASEPELCRMQIRAQFGLLPMETFQKAIHDALLLQYNRSYTVIK